jgi:OFA family oxalate/formate antiporter-like MFS transporter
MDPSKVGPLTSTWPLFCANFGLFTGRVIIGYTADRLGSIQSLVLSLEIAGLLQIVAWHFATSFEGVLAFAFIYGLTGGAALSLIAPVIAQIYGARENMASIVGLAMLSSAPGSMSGPTLAGAVLNASGGRWLTFQAVAGSLQMAGGLIGIWTWWYGVGPMRWGNGHSRRK